jgi:glycosyltransferase involved in cell wall biosynthesis
MRALLISAAFPPMPIPEAEHALHLSNHLTAGDVDVTVLTTNGAGRFDGAARVYPIMWRWRWRELPRFARFLRQNKPEAILLLYLGRMYFAEPMITFAPSIAHAVLPGVRFVTQFENVYGTDTDTCSVPTRAVRRLVKTWAGARDVDHEFGTLLRDSDHIVALSNSFLHRLRQSSATVGTKTSVIPPPPLIHLVAEGGGAARRRGRELLGAKDEDFWIMFFGYSYPGKGLETLLRAFQVVRGVAGNVRLAIVGGVVGEEYIEGPSYARQIRELARSLALEDRVTWTGEYASDSDEASQCLWAADLCVLPLDLGVFTSNSSLAAAVTHGQAVVATRGSSVDPQLIHRENVYLCPARSPDALADAILTVMKDRRLREQLKIGARQLARDCFTWDAAIARTIDVLFSTTGSTRPRERIP